VKQQSNLIQNLNTDTISGHLYATDGILINKVLVVFSGYSSFLHQ